MIHNLKLLITIAVVCVFNGAVVNGYPVKRDQRSHPTSRSFEHGRVINITGHGDAKEYLVEFGYLDPSWTWPESTQRYNNYTKALQNFQRFYKLNVNGILTNNTIRSMTKTRCGNPDNHIKNAASFFNTSHIISGRHKRFAFIFNETGQFGLRFESKIIPYKIYHYTNQLRNEDVDIEIARAFNLWAVYANRTFIQIKDNSRKECIQISFVERDHPCAPGLRAQHLALAHAYPPDRIVPVHIFDDHPWTFNSTKGVNLFQVVAHEIGHALGLAHTPISTAVMFPTAHKYDPNFSLDRDDIRGIKRLYRVIKTNSG